MAETTINVKFQGGVRIDIGGTPQLERLLQKLTATKEEPTQDAPIQEQPTQDPHEAEEEPNPTEEITYWDETIIAMAQAEAEAKAERVAEAKAAENTSPAEDEPRPQEQPQEAASQTYDETAMRKIMESTRVRLLGPSPENKQHPLYKRLNGQFKTEASFATGGRCDKPSSLPDLGQEFCIAFRNGCEALAIDPVTNDIISKPPF